VWVCVPDQYYVGEEIVPTRLVIYEGGVKVDFSFHTLSLVPKVRWIGNYKVLLDKDGLATGMRQSDRKAAPPGEQDFVRLVDEFWFEAYHVAKYLKREELWLAKRRDGAVKELLLRMMEWHQKSRHGWDYDTQEEGKHLKDWFDPSLWSPLQDTFARFDSMDVWRGLSTTLSLFRQLARETADRLGFAYPQEVDANIGGFIASLMPAAPAEDDSPTLALLRPVSAP
jgi:aminoglycoside 6-adenylyltransferase